MHANAGCVQGTHPTILSHMTFVPMEDQIFAPVRKRMKTSARPHLTPREREIVEAVLAAASNRAIADRLGISEQSVKNRLTNIYKKLGVSGRVELVLALMKSRS